MRQLKPLRLDQQEQRPAKNMLGNAESQRSFSIKDRTGEVEKETYFLRGHEKESSTEVEVRHSEEVKNIGELGRAGKTLCADFLGCKVDSLTNVDLIYHSLVDLAQKIGMRIILPPVLVPWNPPLCTDPADWGYTGVLIIAESHIAFHTWPEKKLLNVDISSCKDFDHRLAVKYLGRTFGAKKVHMSVANRY